MIHLVELNKYNTWDVMFLKTRRDQKRFVADNVWSMLHAYTGNKTKGAVYPFGIYNDKKPVGFLLIAYDYSEVCDDPEAPEIAKNNYFLWRIMIDKRYQCRGYGREAVKLALDFIKTFPHGKAEYCWICYDKENKTAKNLYLSMGFQEIGEQGDDINAATNGISQFLIFQTQKCQLNSALFYATIYKIIYCPAIKVKKGLLKNPKGE